MNEIILIILLCLTLLTIFILYKIYDKRGLYFSLIVLNILSFILTFKITNTLKLNINLGIISYISIFSIIYIFMIKYGEKELKELIKISLYSSVFTAIMLLITNYYIPSITETISINIAGSFVYNYKILIVYPLIMLLSEYLSTKLYSFENSIQLNNTICLLLTYIIIGALYTTILNVLSYINILNIKDSAYIGMSTYIIGLIVTIVNIIFVNLLIKSKKVNK